MAAVREWLEAVVLVSVLLAAAESLIPEGTIRKIAGFTGGLILLLTLLRPLTGGTDSRLRLELDRYTGDVEARQAELSEAGTEALAAGIAERTEAYIQDKAADLGLSVRVTVRTKTGEDGIPLPDAADVTGPYSGALASYMEKELGIPQERQVWHEQDEDR